MRITYNDINNIIDDVNWDRLDLDLKKHIEPQNKKIAQLEKVKENIIKQMPIN